MTDTAPTTAETIPSAPGVDLDAVVKQVFGEDAPPVETLAAEVPAEEAVEPVKEAVEEKAKSVSARITAAKRAELKSERDRQELHSLREQLSKQKADQDARDKEQALIEEDPLKYFELKKKGREAIAEHLDKLAGTYKPEAVADKKLSALEQELKSLREEITRRDTEQKAQITRAQADTQWQQASKAFVDHVAAKADAYPHLTEEFTEKQASEEAFRALNEVVAKTSDGRLVTRNEAYFREHGMYPDDDVVAEYLDGLAKARIEARNQSAWRKRDDAPTAGKAPLGEATKSRVNGTSPRTLSSRDTNQRAAAPKPWSQEAADEESIRILEQAMRKRG